MTINKGETIRSKVKVKKTKWPPGEIQYVTDYRVCVSFQKKVIWDLHFHKTVTHVMCTDYFTWECHKKVKVKWQP